MSMFHSTSIKMQKWILIFLFLMFLTGCAATGANFSGYQPLDSSVGEIIVYRPSRFVMGGAYPYIFIDGQRISKLKNGGYVRILRPPGNYTLELKGNMFLTWTVSDIETEVNVEAGKRTIFRLEPVIDGTPIYLGNTGYIPIDSNFGSISEEMARMELLHLKDSFEP